MSSLISFSAMFPDKLYNLSGAKVMDALRQHAGEIAATEHQNISDRTPEQTGTLDASLTESLNPDAQTIMQVYTNPSVQLAGPWGRVYAQYQEGPPLGHTTYTYGMHQYVYAAASEDLGAIESWARKYAGQGVQAMVSDVGQQTIQGP
jgi:hypothetical protein